MRVTLSAMRKHNQSRHCLPAADGRRTLRTRKVSQAMAVVDDASRMQVDPCTLLGSQPAARWQRHMSAMLLHASMCAWSSEAGHQLASTHRSPTQQPISIGAAELDD